MAEAGKIFNEVGNKVPFKTRAKVKILGFFGCELSEASKVRAYDLQKEFDELFDKWVEDGMPM